MGNSEAIDMLRNTGPVVVLVVARIVGGNNQSLQRQKGLSREDLLQAVANDELYGIIILLIKRGSRTTAQQ